jgi:hypothetical protein
MRVIQRALLALCLTLTACASQSSLTEELDRSVKAYNRMLRWHEFENAVMTYGDSEQREASLKRAEALKKQGISITDFRILSTRYVPDKKEGDVVAEFDYYILPSTRVKTVSHRQEWLYQKDLKNWKLKNSLPAFE